MEIIFHKKGPLALSRCGLSAAVECTKGESRIARLKVLCVDKPFARDLFRGRIGILPPYLADDDVAAGTLVRLRRRVCYRHPKTANKRCNRNRLALTPLPENPRPTSRRGSQRGLLCNATDKGRQWSRCRSSFGKRCEYPRKREALRLTVCGASRVCVG